MSLAAPIAERIFDANGEVLLFDVRGLGAVGLQLSGTFTLTVQFEATVDGETFVGLNMLPSNSATAVSSTTAAGAWRANVAGYRLVRARVSAFTSGSANATFLAASTGGAHYCPVRMTSPHVPSSLSGLRMRLIPSPVKMPHLPSTSSTSGSTS